MSSQLLTKESVWSWKAAAAVEPDGVQEWNRKGHQMETDAEDAGDVVNSMTKRGESWRLSVLLLRYCVGAARALEQMELDRGAVHFKRSLTMSVRILSTRIEHSVKSNAELGCDEEERKSKESGADRGGF